MNYAKIKWVDVANGPGVRVSLFVSGCTIHCPSCFNAEAQDFNYGKPFGQGEEFAILYQLRKSYIRGLSILGGEPFDNQDGLIPFLRHVRSNTTKDIWCYTGYTYEQIQYSPMLQYIDVLVDGPFIESQKDIRLRFKGSRNQRILKLRGGKIVGKLD